MKDSSVRELRSVPRYSVNLPVVLTWHAAGQSDRLISGFTRDVSTRGMFVHADAEPQPGDLLEFEIDLALDESTPLVLVEGEGRVVRIERPSSQPAGFAVHNVWFKLREPAQGQAIPLELQAPDGMPAGIPALFRKSDRHRGLSIVPPPEGTKRTDTTDSN